jgi:hypothetical protein
MSTNGKGKKVRSAPYAPSKVARFAQRSQEKPGRYGPVNFANMNLVSVNLVRSNFLEEK